MHIKNIYRFLLNDSGFAFRRKPGNLVFLALIVAFLLVPSLSGAQCAMCRAVLESEGSGNAAEGINNGIVYLMAIPYVLVAGIFYFIYRKMRS